MSQLTAVVSKYDYIPPTHTYWRSRKLLFGPRKISKSISADDLTLDLVNALTNNIYSAHTHVQRIFRR